MPVFQSSFETILWKGFPIYFVSLCIWWHFSKWEFQLKKDTVIYKSLEQWGLYWKFSFFERFRYVWSYTRWYIYIKKISPAGWIFEVGWIGYCEINVWHFTARFKFWPISIFFNHFQYHLNENPKKNLNFKENYLFKGHKNKILY